MKTINVIHVILCFFLFLACTPKKKIKIWGFAYRNDQVVVNCNGKTLSDINIGGARDKNGISHFNEQFNTMVNKKGLALNIIIDSSGNRLLDTVIIISTNYKEPFISVQYPTAETSYKRTLFLADASDSSYLKY